MDKFKDQQNPLNKVVKVESRKKLVERFHSRLNEIIEEPMPTMGDGDPDDPESRERARNRDMQSLFTPTDEFLEDHEDMEKDELTQLLYQMVVRMNFLTIENERLTAFIKENAKTIEKLSTNGQ